ncbi:unnamed protein product, partial [Meganyctiphanes norvegica]
MRYAYFQDKYFEIQLWCCILIIVKLLFKNLYWIIFSVCCKINFSGGNLDCKLGIQITNKHFCRDVARPIVNIVCSNEDNPDEYQRNIFSRQLEQFITMLKSLLYFSEGTYRLVLVTDTINTYHQLVQLMKTMIPGFSSRMTVEHSALWSPSGVDIMQEWRPCSWSKLFLLESLPQDLDSAVYLDTDILFLGPAQGLWDIIVNFNGEQMFGMGPDPLYARHKHRAKYAGTVGLSAGLMALNLTRLRALSAPPGDKNAEEDTTTSGFTRQIMLYRRTHEAYHDQDIANAFLYDHSELLQELSPQWMFSPSECLTGVLPCCTDTGITVLHGFDAIFVRGIEWTFQVLYEVFATSSIETPSSVLLSHLEANLTRAAKLNLESTCRKVFGLEQVLLKQLTDKVKNK